MSASDLTPRDPPAPEVLDLTRLVGPNALVISAETPEDPSDKSHRHSQEAAEGSLRRWKDAVRFGLTILFLGTISGAALYILFDAKASADDKGWARTLLTSVATGLAGYFIGKKGPE